MRFYRVLAFIAVLLLSVPALAQVNPGTSPLSGAKGGTNNASMQFSGPATSIKTYTLPNASGTIGMLNAIATWTAAQSFSDGTVILLGATSGSSTIKAPATGGGTATLFPGTDTIIGAAATQTLTNKTFNCANQTSCVVRLGSDVTGTLPIANNCPGSTGASSSTFLRGDCTWATPAGGGNVSTSGTPAANQIAQWTSSTVVQGVNLVSLLTGSAGICTSGTTTVTLSLCLTNTTLQVSPANQTGTSSATQTMLGLGAAGSPCKITPTYASRVFVSISGQVQNTGSQNNLVQIRFGTGAAPANAAAATGTTVGTEKQFTGLGPTPFNLTGVITGLTPGVQIWLDLTQRTSGNTMTVIAADCAAFELGG